MCTYDNAVEWGVVVQKIEGAKKEKKVAKNV